MHMPEADVQAVVARIQSLTREEAIEAALALEDEVEVEAAAPPADEFVATVESAPFDHLPEAEELARVVLVLAALDPETGPKVEEIVDRVGDKAFIFGGAEIVALVGLAVLAIHLFQTKGKKSETETTQIVIAPDGTQTIMHKTETIYGIDPAVGEVVAGAVGGGLPGPTGP
jgi:hypothetical protein